MSKLAEKRKRERERDRDREIKSRLWDEKKIVGNNK
jgi:hypothetical protein